MLRTAAPTICALALCGCSYSYDVQTKVAHGRLIFDANPQWSADCLREIVVRVDDDPSETLWEDAVSYENACKNKFPIAYGDALRGEPFINDIVEVVDGEGQQPSQATTPKKLRVGVIYIVSTNTGATGYGCGRFRISPDLRVQNLGCS